MLCEGETEACRVLEEVARQLDESGEAITFTVSWNNRWRTLRCTAHLCFKVLRLIKALLCLLCLAVCCFVGAVTGDSLELPSAPLSLDAMTLIPGLPMLVPFLRMGLLESAGVIE